MKLTRASEYALHALAHLAKTKPDGAVPSHIMAQAQGIPERFLLKVLKPLVSAGVLRSVKGPNGGYRLARPATQVTILEVIEASEGPIRGLAPSTGAESAAKLDQKLEEVCNDVAGLVRDRLGKVRVSDLAKK